MTTTPPGEPEGIRRIGMTDILSTPTGTYSRTAGQTRWRHIAASKPPEPAEPEPLIPIMIVREDQATNERDHWSLFAAHGEGQSVGTMYQVTGDATLMTYQKLTNVNIMIAPGFKDAFELANLTKQQADLLDELAADETPPQAPDEKTVTETCQGWTVRLIQKLVDRGLVDQAKIDHVKALQQPLEEQTIHQPSGNNANGEE